MLDKINLTTAILYTRFNIKQPKIQISQCSGFVETILSAVFP